MKVVYVAGKFRGPTAWDVEQNIRAAELVGMQVARAGASPLIPHANTRFFHGTIDDAFWLEATVELLRRCDAVLLVPGWEESHGARAEKEEAHQLGKPVFAQAHQLESWLDGFNEPPARGPRQ